MYSIYGIDQRKPTNVASAKRYENFSSELVNGVVKLTPCPPVSRSLADEFSVTMNALTRQNDRPLRQRLNVDALDLENEMSHLS